MGEPTTQAGPILNSSTGRVFNESSSYGLLSKAQLRLGFFYAHFERVENEEEFNICRTLLRFLNRLNLYIFFPKASGESWRFFLWA